MLATPALAAVCLGVAWAVSPQRPSLPEISLAGALGVLMVLADLRPVRVGPAQKMTLAAVPALVAALILPPPLAASAAAAAPLLSNRFLRRRLRNALFNSAVIAVAVAGAGALGGLAGDTSVLAVARAAAGAALFSSLTVGMSALASAAQRQAPPARCSPTPSPTPGLRRPRWARWPWPRPCCCSGRPGQPRCRSPSCPWSTGATAS